MTDLSPDSLSALSELTTKLRAATRAIEQTYLRKSSPRRLALPLGIRGPILEGLESARNVDELLSDPRKDLTAGLYASDFQSYLRHTVIGQAHGVLAGTTTSSYVDGYLDGLASSFCL